MFALGMHMRWILEIRRLSFSKSSNFEVAGVSILKSEEEIRWSICVYGKVHIFIN